MNLRKCTRSLAMASLLGLAVLSVPAVHVEAKQKTTAQPKLCAYYDNDTGEWNFYLPGQTLTVKDSSGQDRTLSCQDSGVWILLGRAATVTGGLSGPQPIGDTYQLP